MKISAGAKATTGAATPPSQPPVRPPRRPLTGWVLVLPIILLLGLLFEARQETHPPTPVAAAPTPSAPQLTPVPGTNVTPPSGPAATPHGNKTVTSYTLYVPGPDDKLHERIVPQPTGEPKASPTPAQYEAWYNQQANRALALLFKERNIFPPGTQTPQASLKNDIVNLNLNKNFGSSKLWKSELITTLVVYCLVNTLLSPGLKRAGKPKGVLLLIDHHPITTLGEFDTSDPIEPNLALVAKS